VQSGYTYSAKGVSGSFANIPGDPGETADVSAITLIDKKDNGRVKIILSISLLIIFLITLGIFTVKIYESTGAIMDRAVHAPLIQPEPLATRESVPPSEDNSGPAAPIGGSSPEPVLPPLSPCNDGQARVNGTCPPPPAVAPPPAVVVPPPVVILPPPQLPPHCPDGRAPVKGTCSTSEPPRCTDGKMPVKSKCPESPCEDGQKRIEGKCPDPCAHSQKGANSTCLPPPPPPPLCEDGQKRVGDKCPTPVSSSPCAKGQTLVNGVCTSRPDSPPITKSTPAPTKTTPPPPVTKTTPPPITKTTPAPTKITPVPQRRPEAGQQRPPNRIAPGPQRSEGGQQRPSGRTAPGPQRPG
jgi:hypothetical protein